MVVHPILLPLARLARRAGDDANHFGTRLEQLLANGRLTGAGRRRDQQQQSLRGGDSHKIYSTFWTCSRNRSSSALIMTTSREMTASFALDPMVLISRFISCERKSSVRPTGSFAFRQSSNCLK